MAAEAARRHPENRLTTRVIYGLLACTARNGSVQSLYYVELPENCRSRGRRSPAERLAGVCASARADAVPERDRDEPARSEEAANEENREEKDGQEEDRQETRSVERPFQGRRLRTGYPWRVILIFVP